MQYDTAKAVSRKSQDLRCRQLIACAALNSPSYLRDRLSVVLELSKGVLHLQAAAGTLLYEVAEGIWYVGLKVRVLLSQALDYAKGYRAVAFLS